MGFYVDRVLPYLVDAALGGKQFGTIRERVCSPLEGDVVEIGFGSGRNVPYYPSPVTRVRAVDPATVGRKLAAKRVAASVTPVEYVGLNGAELPMEDDSVDHVLTTWTLCTIPEVDKALTEMRRVLRPGGRLHFVEHGRSPDANVARWQDRLNPLQRRFVGGCHLNRQIDQLITTAGLELDGLENFYARGPKAFGYLFEGTAIKH
jgi:ubiquinone/menaquinone biosynthesis C-methylase UbiE